jgi:hypothetical protein
MNFDILNSESIDDLQGILKRLVTELFEGVTV